jgi:hypothetical protein
MPISTVRRTGFYCSPLDIPCPYRALCPRRARPGRPGAVVRARGAAGGSPAARRSRRRWLHLTTQGIGFTDEVSDGDLTAITAAAHGRLLAVRPAEVMLSAPHAASEGVASYVGPDGALDPARNALRAAIGDVWGADKVPELPEWAPHVSYAYANADADADGSPYDAALDGLGPVSATVTAVELIRLGRDRRVYEWQTIASLPLGDRG